MAAVHIIARDPELQGMVKLMFTTTAIAAINEDDAYANHAERVIMAGKVLHGVSDPYDLTMGVLTNSAVQTAILADEELTFFQIQTAVDSVYDSFALTA